MTDESVRAMSHLVRSGAMLLAGLSLLVLVARVGTAHADGAASPPAFAVGRYEINTATFGSSVIVNLIDTSTGKVWTKMGQGGWQPLPDPWSPPVTR